ncbi:MAG: helix-turn-helix transcriptional regulator, partial [Trebonia sp.]
MYSGFHSGFPCNLRDGSAEPAVHARGTRRRGCPMTEPGSPTVRRRRLAAELREIRESRGRSGESVAAALGWSPSKISRYERAKTGLRPR